MRRLSFAIGADTGLRVGVYGISQYRESSPLPVLLRLRSFLLQLAVPYCQIIANDVSIVAVGEVSYCQTVSVRTMVIPLIPVMLLLLRFCNSRGCCCSSCPPSSHPGISHPPISEEQWNSTAWFNFSGSHGRVCACSRVVPDSTMWLAAVIPLSNLRQGSCNYIQVQTCKESSHFSRAAKPSFPLGLCYARGAALAEVRTLVER